MRHSALPSALLTSIALLSAGCTRDLVLPASPPPEVTGVALAGHEAAPVTAGLPVLAGQLLAIEGSGFPDNASLLQVQIGGAAATALSVAPTRLVVAVPVLSTAGDADLTVVTPSGPRTLTGALRYDGPGAPSGFGTTETTTTVPLTGVAPVMVQTPAAGPAPYPDLVVAWGASDSVLLVSGRYGLALATIPVGLVPDAVAARSVVKTLSPLVIEVQVVAIDREGSIGGGTIQADVTSGFTLTSRSAPVVTETSSTAPLRPATGTCDQPRLLSLRYDPVPTNPQLPPPPVLVTWTGTTAGAPKPKAALLSRAANGAWSVTAGSAFDLKGPVAAWVAQDTTKAILAIGGELLRWDTSVAASGTNPSTLMTTDATPQPAASAFATGCRPAAVFTSLDWVVDNAGQQYLAAAWRDGAAISWIGQLTGLSTASVRHGSVGLPVTAVAIARTGPLSSPVPLPFGAALNSLERVAVDSMALSTCAQSLVVDAAWQLDPDPLATLPSTNALLGVGDGTRLFAVTPAGDLVTVLAASMTSSGGVYRFAAYAGAQTVVTDVPGRGVAPLAVLEHLWSPLGVGDALDAGGAALVLDLASDRGALSVGGAAYGRGAAFVADATDTALLLAGDPPRLSVTDTSPQAGAGRLQKDSCATGGFRFAGDRGDGGSPPSQLLVGPARSGAFGPGGAAVVGPASPPVYMAFGTSLVALDDASAAGAACLLGSASTPPAWSGCAPSATWNLGVAPLDVTLSAGDATAAVRTLGTTCACAAPFACSGTTAGACNDPNDPLCLRASCPVAASLRLVPASGAPIDVALPRAPLGVAADPAGGFLLTMACDPAPRAAGTGCFATGSVCTSPLTTTGSFGALLQVDERTGALHCLAVRAGLEGPLALSPNGAEAWATAPDVDGNLVLTRIALARRASDGAIDRTRPHPTLSRDTMGRAAAATGAFPASGVTFAPDGSVAVVTVPGEFKVVLRR